MYEVSEKLRHLKMRLISIDGQTIDSETGEILGDEAAAKLESELMEDLLKDQAEGAEAALKIIQELEAFNIAIKEEKNRLSLLAAARNQKISRIKDAVLKSMINTDQNSINTALGSFKINKGRESVVINDIEKLKANYPKLMRTKVTTAPDKKAIGEAIKNGLDLDGIAEKVRGEPTLTIK